MKYLGFLRYCEENLLSDLTHISTISAVYWGRVFVVKLMDLVNETTETLRDGDCFWKQIPIQKFFRIVNNLFSCIKELKTVFEEENKAVLRQSDWLPACKRHVGSDHNYLSRSYVSSGYGNTGKYYDDVESTNDRTVTVRFCGFFAKIHRFSFKKELRNHQIAQETQWIKGCKSCFAVQDRLISWLPNCHLIVTRPERKSLLCANVLCL